MARYGREYGRPGPGGFDRDDRGYRTGGGYTGGPGAAPGYGYGYTGAPGAGGGYGYGHGDMYRGSAYGYGRDFGAPYDREYKSREQMERGDPFGDRARGAPVRLMRGEFHAGDRDRASRYDRGFRGDRGRYDRGWW